MCLFIFSWQYFSHFEKPTVFFLKGKIILSNSHEGAIFLAEGKNNIVLIEERHLKDFKFFAKNLDLNLDEIKNVQGFNYSKGKKVKIYFYKSIHWRKSLIYIRQIIYEQNSKNFNNNSC